MTTKRSAAGTGLPQNDNTPPRPSNDVLKEACQRRVAAKIVEILPPDDTSARRILALASQFYDEFVSVEVSASALAEAAR